MNHPDSIRTHEDSCDERFGSSVDNLSVRQLLADAEAIDSTVCVEFDLLTYTKPTYEEEEYFQAETIHRLVAVLSAGPVCQGIFPLDISPQGEYTLGYLPPSWMSYPP